MTKRCAYKVKITGEPNLVQVLSPFISENQEKLGRARELRRATEVIFGDKVKVNIYSVARLERSEVKAL